jgi:NADPH:quinone reductase-like Zn-dependent oxidoreductase
MGTVMEFQDNRRVSGDYLVHMPPTLAPAVAAALGTAGYAAALSHADGSSWTYRRKAVKQARL